jgi:hypothetical protein
MREVSDWAISKPGFLGSTQQLLCCACCGELLREPRGAPRRCRDIGKPTIHFICDTCFDALPDQTKEPDQ